MDWNTAKTWYTQARERLDQAPAQHRVTLLYTGLTLGLSALVTLIVYLLDLSIAQASGLSGMANRALLSTLQTMLPLGLNLFLLCLDVGFLAAMLRVCRGQYLSPQTLRLGFDRFWVLLRSALLQGLLYFVVCLPSGYLAVAIYMLTPWSASLLDALIPLMSETTAASQVLSDALADQLMTAMKPCLALCYVFMGIACLILSYRYRMVNFILIDKPGTGAIAAMRQSRAMMKGNCNKLFKLDLRMWWYFGVAIAAGVAGDLDQFFPSLFPSEAFGYWASYVLYLLVLAGSYLFLRGRVQVTYCFAYEAMKPKEQPKQGVVLGNIFQM